MTICCFIEQNTNRQEIRDRENISVKEFMSIYKYFTLLTTNHSLSHGNHRLCFRIETIAVAHYKT